LNTHPSFSWSRTIRLALIPGVFAFSAALVPFLGRTVVAQTGFIPSLQALAGLLFLLLVGMSFRFNRRKALLQTLVVGLFWLGVMIGDPVRHPWYQSWTEPMVIIALAVIEVLPEKRIFSLSTAVMLLVLAWLFIVFGFSLRSNLTLPAGGFGFFLVLAALAMIAAAVRFVLQNDRTHAVFFWSVAVFVVSAFQVEDLLSASFFKSIFPFGLYSLSVFIALHVYSLLETSYHLAYHDQLTGLPGRRALEEALSHAGEVYCLAMADVDKFKAFNDKHGHDVGDEVLRLVGATLGAVKHGRAFRYGGEEFVLFFPGLSPEEAVLHAEEVRSGLGRYQFALRRPKRLWPWDGKKNRKQTLQVVSDETPSKAKAAIRITMSIGVASRKEGEESTSVLKRADQALYKAKEAGRDRLVQG